MATPSIPERSGEVVRVPFLGGFIETVLVNGEPHVVIRSALTGMGLDADSQMKKLKRKSWATTVMTTVVADDGKAREMAAIDLETWSMLLANIDEARVSDAARPIVVDYQKKSARALRDFWTKGGAINPTASVEQVQALREELDTVQRATEAEAQLRAIEVLARIDGNTSYARSLSRHIAARMLGEEPELDPDDVTITCDEYLASKGVADADLGSARTRLGKTVAALYRARHGKDPQKIKRPIRGVHRDVAVYTNRDIDLFDTAWVEVGRHYHLQQFLGGAA